MSSSLRRAFTLIELLVVVTIIVVLLAILIPAGGKAVFTSEVALCSTQLHQWTVALTSYASDSSGMYPRHDGNLGAGNPHDVADTFSVVMQRDYAVPLTLFGCPFRTPGWTAISPPNTVPVGNQNIIGYGYWAPRLCAGTQIPPDSCAGPRTTADRSPYPLMTDDLIEYPNYGWPTYDTWTRYWGMPHEYGGTLVNIGLAYADGSVQLQGPDKWEFRFQSGNARLWY
jgi:prepilin-type N-terminal cleavage/methylation domain-containing protein